MMPINSSTSGELVTGAAKYLWRAAVWPCLVYSIGFILGILSAQQRRFAQQEPFSVSMQSTRATNQPQSLFDSFLTGVIKNLLVARRHKNELVDKKKKERRMWKIKRVCAYICWNDQEFVCACVCVCVRVCVCEREREREREMKMSQCKLNGHFLPVNFF